MKKFTLTALGLAAIGLTAYFLFPVESEIPTLEIPKEKVEYAEFMNNYIENMPKGSPGKKKPGDPDMFYEFDKLKRVDPTTGEVPADGLMKAYLNLKEQFGDIATQRTNYSLDWEERGPTGVGGRSRAVLWDPNATNNHAVFAGGVGGGLWYTPDITVSSPNWTSVSQMFSNVAVTCIAADPNNPQTMYYGTGEGWNNADALRGAGIWKSTDGGMSWDVLPSTSGPEFYYNQKILVRTNGDVYAATKGGLLRSEDGGATWNKVLGSSAGASNDWINDLDEAGNGDLWASVNGNGVYRSPASLGTAVGDSGQWTRVNVNYPSSFGRIELTAGVNNSNYVYFVVEASNSAAAIFRTTNAGGSWAQVNMPTSGNYTVDQAWYDMCIQVNPSNHLQVLTGTLNQHRTVNGGTSWGQLSNGGTMHVDQHGIFFNPANSNELIFSNDGGIYYSPDAGLTQYAKNNNYNVTQFYSISVDPRSGNNRLIGGTQDNGTWSILNPGISSGVKLTGADGSFCAIDHSDPDTYYTTYQYQTVNRTTNDGFTWAQITNPNLSQSDVLFINPLEMDPNNGKQLYQAASALWRRNNASVGGGSGWVQAGPALGGRITAIGISKNIANLLYFAVNGTIYRMPNANIANFTTQPTAVNPSGLANGYISCVAVNPLDGNHVVIVYSSYGLTTHVMETRDADLGANATWKDLSGNLPDLPCNWAVFEPNNPKGIVIGTDLGAYRCGDATVPEQDIYWATASQGMGFPRIDMMEVRENDQTLHAATHGRGFFSSYSYANQPVANFGVVDDSVCGGTVQFIDSTSSVPSSWAWDFGDGGTSTLQSPAHTYASSGTYTVSLIVTNANGTDSTVRTISIVSLPGVTAVASPDVDACPGDTVQLTASGGVTYSWSPSFGLSDPNIANPTYNVTGTRTFVVTATDQFGCFDTDTVVVTQQPAPNTWAGPDQTISFVGDSVQLSGAGGTTFSWSPAAGLSCTTCPDPMASPDTTTTYTLTSTNANGCSRTDQVTVFVNIVSVEEGVNATLQVESVYPNPVKDQLVVAYELKQAENVRIELVDVNGKVLSLAEEAWQDAGRHEMRWNRDNGIAAGLYFVRITAGAESLVRRITLLD